MQRRAVFAWITVASFLPWLCSGWPWPWQLMASGLVCAVAWWSSASLRAPFTGPVRRILAHGDAHWLLFTPRGVFVATIEHALRLGPLGWWLQFATGGRPVWCWLSAAAPDQIGYRRMARVLTARWT